MRIVSNAGLVGYTMKVYDDDAPGGLPGTLLDSVQIAAAQVTVGDQVIPLSAPLTINSGGVYVQWYMLGANITIAQDITPPFSLQTYEVIDGVWAEYRDRTIQDFFLGLRLAQAPVNDVGCTGFFGLADGQAIGSQTAVRAWIRNFGNQPASAFDVHYRFGQGTVVTQAYNGPVINPGQQQLFTFSTYYIPTADDTDDLCAWTSMAGDDLASNDTACVLVNTYVGIEEGILSQVRFVPVPADDVMRVEGLSPGLWDLRVADAAGRVVRSASAQGSSPVIIGTADLMAGAYTLLLRGESGAAAKRFVIRH